MRKIIAAVFIFLSVISYSQWSNTFSEEGGEEMKSNPKDVDPEPGHAVAADPSQLPMATPCPGQTTTMEEDCNCNGVLDEIDPEDCGPPNPADPIPIDNYIPLLVILAAGLITYKTYGRKSLS